MNERIRELVRISYLDVYGLGKDREKWESTVNHFAELIVRECAEVAGCNGHVSGFTLGDLIKEHFGVE